MQTSENAHFEVGLEQAKGTYRGGNVKQLVSILLLDLNL